MPKFYRYTLLKKNAGRPLALIICNKKKTCDGLILNKHFTHVRLNFINGEKR